MASNYSYRIAKQILSETEKDRFVACFLNALDPNAVNWEKASSDFGSASVASFKKMIQNAQKKLKDAEANGLPETPVATPKKAAGGRKRKSGSDATGEADDAETPKKKGKKAVKKTDAAAADDDSVDQTDAKVKEEHAEDF